MKHLVIFSIAICLFAFPVFAEVSTEKADGFFVIEPASERSCVAVRVDVSEDQAVSGIRWFNGSLSQGFARVLVASGADVSLPGYNEAMVLAENTVGLENGWSELSFTEPVASLTGTLFVILQYPANYEPVDGEAPVGVGYKVQDGTGHYFLSGDGDSWLKISNSCRLLLEPVYVARDPNMASKNSVSGGEKPAESVLPGKLSLNAYPNPFNPETQIELSLPRSAMVSVKVFDVQGRLVRSLYGGETAAGTKVLKWQGRDDRGRSVGSGVYFALVQVGEKTLTNRLVLIK